YARPVSVVFQRVGVVNEPLAAHKSFARTAWGGAKSVALPHPLDIPRVTAHRHVLNVFPVIGVKMSVGGSATPHGFLGHRGAHRGEVAWRGFDALQSLRGRGLASQCLIEPPLQLGVGTPQFDYFVIDRRGHMLTSSAPPLPEDTSTGTH